MATGVLLTGFGGPDSLEAVGPFMCNLMGREPSEELVERVCKRYLAIGGSSPLAEIAAEIALGIEDALAASAHPMSVVVGMRYWDPYIQDALARLKGQGCDKVITVSLSPFESKVAHGAYREAIDQAAAELGGLEIVEAPLVSRLDEYSDYFAESAAAALSEIDHPEGIIIVFSAHSLPASDLVDDDPYVSGLRATADAVALKLGLAQGVDGEYRMLGGVSAFGSDTPPRAWYLAYQSKGNRPGAWLGPDIDDIIDAVAGTEVKGVVVCPIGFMTDHMETLYDLDIVAAERAIDAELVFVRAPVPNAHPDLVEAVARAVAALA